MPKEKEPKRYHAFSPRTLGRFFFYAVVSSVLLILLLIGGDAGGLEGKKHRLRSQLLTLGGTALTALGIGAVLLARADRIPGAWMAGGIAGLLVGLGLCGAALARIAADLQRE